MADGGKDFSDALECDGDISSSSIFESDFSVISEPDELVKSRHLSDGDITAKDKQQLATAYHFLKDANSVIQKKLAETENCMRKYAKKLHEVEKSRKQLLEQYSKYVMDNPDAQEIRKMKTNLESLHSYMKELETHGMQKDSLQQMIMQIESIMLGEDTDVVKAQLSERGHTNAPPVSNTSRSEGSPREKEENMNDLQRKLRNYESELLLRRQESDIVHEQLNSLQEELPRLRARIQALQRELKKERESRSLEKVGHLKKISDMESKVKEFENINDQLTARVKSLTVDLKDLDSTLCKEQEMKETYKQRYLKLGTEFEDLKTSYEKKIEALEVEVEHSKELVHSAPSHVSTSAQGLSGDQQESRTESFDKEIQTDVPNDDPDLVVDGAPEEDVMEHMEEIGKLVVSTRQKVDEQNQLIRILMDQAGQMVSLPKPLREDKPLSMPTQEVDQHGGPTVYPPDPVSLTLKKKSENQTGDIKTDKTMMEAQLDDQCPMGESRPKPAKQELQLPHTHSSRDEVHRYQDDQQDTSDEDLYGAGRVYQEGTTKAPPEPIKVDKYTFHPRPDELKPPVDYSGSFPGEDLRTTPQGSPQQGFGEAAFFDSEETTLITRGSSQYQRDGQDVRASGNKPVADGLSRRHAAQGNVSQLGLDNSSANQQSSLNPINPAGDWQQAEQLQLNYWQHSEQTGEQQGEQMTIQAGQPYEGHQEEFQRHDGRFQVTETSYGETDVVRAAYREEDEDVRECPMCYALFPKSISAEDFSAHVNDHFTEDDFQMV
ncbi:myosin heavy chain, clone 203-like [Ptychodera flava]|uniref:myosin heavy chain, clone 203-like n=1 Tax=Ptychodera flava TaxID=63121 RepID=UPI00396A043D